MIMNRSFNQFKATREERLITGGILCYQTDGPISRGGGGICERGFEFVGVLHVSGNFFVVFL